MPPRFVRSVPGPRLARRPALVVLLLLLPATSGLAKEGPDRLTRSIQKRTTKIAAVWSDLARDLTKRGLRDAARDAVVRARALDPALEGLEEVSQAVEALPEAGTLDAAARKRIQKARHDAAKGYDKLARLFQKQPDDIRGVRYAVTALDLDPSSRRRQQLAVRLSKGPALLASPKHEAVAYVTLPSGWRPGRTYPVLVSVDGAGANFKGNANAFRGARGARPFITVAPHALSCTNALKPAKYPAYPQALLDRWNAKRTAFDIPGLVAMLDFLHEHFGAESKVAITGFSGGGGLCYGFLFAHPERVFCAAPACANFQPGLAARAKSPAGGGPPIHIFTGEKDPHRYLTHGTTPPGIEEQTDHAVEAFEEHGFTHVQRTMLPGVGHSNCVAQVWAFVDEVRGKK